MPLTHIYQTQENKWPIDGKWPTLQSLINLSAQIWVLSSSIARIQWEIVDVKYVDNESTDFVIFRRLNSIHSHPPTPW